MRPPPAGLSGQCPARSRRWWVAFSARGGAAADIPSLGNLLQPCVPAKQHDKCSRDRRCNNKTELTEAPCNTES
jgi:hypothetical protein